MHTYISSVLGRSTSLIPTLQYQRLNPTSALNTDIYTHEKLLQEFIKFPLISPCLLTTTNDLDTAISLTTISQPPITSHNLPPLSYLSFSQTTTHPWPPSTPRSPQHLHIPSFSFPPSPHQSQHSDRFV